ncbi:hypothetical protein NC652_000757 [Populus alba x Populus x berolinensis]|nr:hypothetical protein NC652_000757 [Populus alba x Populus x berolinensis]
MHLCISHMSAQLQKNHLNQRELGDVSTFPLTVLWLILDLELSPKRAIFCNLPLPPLVEQLSSASIMWVYLVLPFLPCPEQLLPLLVHLCSSAKANGIRCALFSHQEDRQRAFQICASHLKL